MSNYTVQGGDSLWKIASQQYSLSNAKDIQKAVNIIAKENNIENPNLIYKGDTLNLPSIFDEADSKKNANTDTQGNFYDQSQKKANIYEQFVNWDINQTKKLQNGEQTGSFKFGNYDKTKHDIKSEMEACKNFAAAQIETVDIKDKDGNIDYSEWLKNEVKNYNKTFEDEQLTYDEKTGQITSGGHIIDTAGFEEEFDTIDQDKNGKLDIDELSAYWMVLDKADNPTADYFDSTFRYGTISANSVTKPNFIEALKAAFGIFKEEN